MKTPSLPISVLFLFSLSPNRLSVSAVTMHMYKADKQFINTGFDCNNFGNPLAAFNWYNILCMRGEFTFKLTFFQVPELRMSKSILSLKECAVGKVQHKTDRCFETKLCEHFTKFC